MRKALAAGLIALGVLQAAPARALPLLVPPVDGTVTRRFAAPASRFGPGHRGIDYAVPEGTSVRASADGTVTFAGRVAGVLAVTIDHGSGLQTTYSDLALVYVGEGELVTEGRWLGTVGVAHRGGLAGLHFGVKLDGVYVDPQAYLGPADAEGAISLAPVVSEDVFAAEVVRPFLATTNLRGCRRVAPLVSAPSAPNDNIAVTISGLSSSSGAAPPRGVSGYGRRLGYETSYEFSYAGMSGVSLHRTYGPSDTYGDLRKAAERLRELLLEIARRHPGRDVDLIAHSQGGIVARIFLETLAPAWDSDLPRVEHLVTFATPHGGAPLAGEARDLQGTLTGSALLRLARHMTGGGLPSPESRSVGQLDPGSDLLRSLAAEDVVNGTRVLALGMPNDVVVPADRALWPGERGKLVSPEGLNGHGAILESAEAAGVAHSFLRGAPAACRTGWDRWGPRLGRLLGWGEGGLDWAFRGLELVVNPGMALARMGD